MHVFLFHLFFGDVKQFFLKPPVSRIMLWMPAYTLLEIRGTAIRSVGRTFPRSSMMVSTDPMMPVEPPR
jgi:hypothetical protein